MMTSQFAAARSWRFGAPIALDRSSQAPVRPDLRALASGLLAIHPAWLLLDAHGRVCDLSRHARSLLGLCLDFDGERGVQAVQRSDHEALRTLVSDALSESSPGWSGTIFLRAEDEAMTLGVVAVSLGLDGAVLLLQDLAGRHDSRVAPFLVSLGLTGAEARVALRIGHGESPASVAHALGVTHDTVRSQLRAVFHKLRFTRQSQLAVLVTRLEGCLPPTAEELDPGAIAQILDRGTPTIPFPAMVRRRPGSPVRVGAD